MRIELPILCFLTLPLLLIPLPWHWSSRNVALLTMIVSLFLLNLIVGINAVLWDGSVVPKLHVWCDITTKFIIGAQVSLPAASFCITKHLESVASVRHTVTTSDDKRRRTIFELCLCVVFPVVIMALHYIVQGHRFDIWEDIGCMPVTYWSWQGFLIVYAPPLVLAFLCACYGLLAFRWFVRRRAQFAEHLRSGNSGFTTNRYMRLMALAMTQVVFGTCVGGYALGTTITTSTWREYKSWENVHRGFSRIAGFPRVLIPEYMSTPLLMTRYISPIGSIIFFLFFGFGEDALNEYARLWESFRTKILGLPPKVRTESVLPTFSAPPRNTSQASSDHVVKIRSFDNLSIAEKWDDDEAMDDPDGSNQPDCASLRRSTDASTISRPMSTPPLGSAPSAPSSPTRGRSLDFHRDVGPVH